jgi:hypothetical protein
MDEQPKPKPAPKSKRDYATWSLALLFAASLVFSYFEGKKTDEIIEITAINHRQLLDSLGAQNVLIATFRAENKIYQVTLQGLMKDREVIKAIEKQISKNYEKIQDEIHGTADSLQYGITIRLLTKHRDTPFKRD